MRKQLWIGLAATILTLAGSVAAQHTQGAKMDHDMMSAMHNSPQHMMMVAHHKNVENFAKALADMSAEGKFEDVESARSAVAEIKESMTKMKGIHQSHLKKMSPDMREHMKPMMEKMQTESSSIMQHIEQIDTALSAPEPSASAVHQHASAVLEQIEKMKRSDMKLMDKMDKSEERMRMPEKKP